MGDLTEAPFKTESEKSMVAKRESHLCGWFLCDKPRGVTSAHFLRRFQRFLGVRRLGHSGTLDPFASGLLLVCVGRATRLLSGTKNWTKRYVFCVRWGRETDTGDVQGRVTKTSSVMPDAASIRQALKEFTGVIRQTPPRFSAVKVDGRRAYQRARGAESFVLKSRAQRIDQFDLLRASEKMAWFSVVCDTGTYVRALGEDLARALGAVGHVCFLRRTSLGKWTESDVFGGYSAAVPALSPQLKEKGTAGKSGPLAFLRQSRQDSNLGGFFIREPWTLLDDIPVVQVSLDEARALSQGACVSRSFSFEGKCLCRYASSYVVLAEVASGLCAPKAVLVRPFL